jgi:hypothetical protein
VFWKVFGVWNECHQTADQPSHLHTYLRVKDAGGLLPECSRLSSLEAIDIDGYPIQRTAEWDMMIELDSSDTMIRLHRSMHLLRTRRKKPHTTINRTLATHTQPLLKKIAHNCQGVLAQLSVILKFCTIFPLAARQTRTVTKRPAVTLHTPYQAVLHNACLYPLFGYLSVNCHPCRLAETEPSIRPP